MNSAPIQLRLVTASQGDTKAAPSVPSMTCVTARLAASGGHRLRGGEPVLGGEREIRADDERGGACRG